MRFIFSSDSVISAELGKAIVAIGFSVLVKGEGEVSNLNTYLLPTSRIKSQKRFFMSTQINECLEEILSIFFKAIG